MSSKYLNSTIDYIRLLGVIVILSLLALFVVTGDSNPWFLSSSGVILVLALINYIDLKNGTWAKFSLLLFIGMICGFLGDLFMADVISLTPISLLDGVILFGIGHVFYLLGLKDRSPLLRNSEGLIMRNLLIWIASIVGVLLLFVFTLFNPLMFEISIGLLGYGILLVTVLGFALAKWFDEFPIAFRILIFFGFFMFIFSDWLIGVHELTEPTFLSGPLVGITYIFAQLPIHLATFLGARGTE
ncbi:MAG: lysoplasmalogenase family protein [Candidatus Thorarchaeota archaeon]